VPDQIHLALAVLAPQVDVDDVHRMVYLAVPQGNKVSQLVHCGSRISTHTHTHILYVNLLPRAQVRDYEAHTWRRRDWAAVLDMTKSVQRDETRGLGGEFLVTNLVTETTLRARLGCCATYRLPACVSYPTVYCIHPSDRPSDPSNSRISSICGLVDHGHGLDPRGGHSPVARYRGRGCVA